MCDVYVYEDCMGGWTTHVAGNRSIFPPIPEIPFSWLPRVKSSWDKENRKVLYDTRKDKIIGKITARIWGYSHRLRSWSLGLIPKKKIGLEFDGETFNDPTADECADRLVVLKELGYNVPNYAIESLRGEDQPLIEE
jgi:hypothetical protein